ncbi:uncharacterized protein LOC135484110 isoform X2 [Lineus longissimus]
MASFSSVRNGQSCPANAIRAPDRNNSVVCLWQEKETGTFGRGDVNHHQSGLQAWFPWGGKEYDSQSLSRFDVLVGNNQHRYAWLRVTKVNREPRFQPYVINGYSPCVINGLLGKAKIRGLEGWTSWGGEETHHRGDEIYRSLVLCVLPKSLAANMVYCYTGQNLPREAIRADGCQQGSYVAHWNGAELGTFGRASLNAHRAGLQAWFPYGGKEHDSQTIGSFEIACKNYDFDYSWEPIEKVQKSPWLYEVLENGGYCPAIINGLLGKADIKRGMAWTCWGGVETAHTGQPFKTARVLCAKMKMD